MLKTVSFYGICLANSELTLVGDVIGHPFQLRRIRCKFAAGVANEMRLRFILSEDDDAPAIGQPSGVSVLLDYGQVDFVTGEDEVILMDHEVDVAIANSWLKVHADNRDFNDHAVNVQLTIDTLMRR